MKIEIYADVACPWCYIGERRLARAIAAFPGGHDMEVSCRPSQLEPGAPATATPIPRYLARRFGRPVDEMLARVTTVAAGEGITDEARARGVQAVPPFVFDGQYVVEGAQPASTFL